MVSYCLIGNVEIYGYEDMHGLWGYANSKIHMKISIIVRSLKKVNPGPVEATQKNYGNM